MRSPLRLHHNQDDVHGRKLQAPHLTQTLVRCRDVGDPALELHDATRVAPARDRSLGLRAAAVSPSTRKQVRSLHVSIAVSGATVAVSLGELRLQPLVHATTTRLSTARPSSSAAMRAACPKARWSAGSTPRCRPRPTWTPSASMPFTSPAVSATPRGCWQRWWAVRRRSSSAATPRPTCSAASCAMSAPRPLRLECTLTCEESARPDRTRHAAPATPRSTSVPAPSRSAPPWLPARVVGRPTPLTNRRSAPPSTSSRSKRRMHRQASRRDAGCCWRRCWSMPRRRRWGLGALLMALGHRRAPQATQDPMQPRQAPDGLSQGDALHHRAAAAVAWPPTLRTIGAQPPDAQGSTLLLAIELEVLLARNHSRSRSPRCPLFSDVAVAQILPAVVWLGGPIARNGRPGWQRLYAGWEQLSQQVEGAMLLGRTRRRRRGSQRLGDRGAERPKDGRRDAGGPYGVAATSAKGSGCGRFEVPKALLWHGPGAKQPPQRVAGRRCR